MNAEANISSAEKYQQTDSNKFFVIKHNKELRNLFEWRNIVQQRKPKNSVIKNLLQGLDTGQILNIILTQISKSKGEQQAKEPLTELR